MINREIESYLDEEDILSLIKEDGSLFDIFGYWKKRKRSHPILYRMHLDFSPIQGNFISNTIASSAPCERIFSSSKQVIGEHRVSLKPKTTELLMMEKHRLKNETTELSKKMKVLYKRKVICLINVRKANLAKISHLMTLDGRVVMTFWKMLPPLKVKIFN